MDNNWITEFCDLILHDKVSISWSCISSASLVDESVFKRMVESGCIKINFGIETGSERIAKLIKRSVKMEKIRQVFEYTRKYGVSTAAYVMIGFPTETIKDIQDTQRFIRELSPNWVYANVLVPLPGTETFRMCVDSGLLDEKKAWSGELYRDLQTNYTGVIDNSKFNELVDETFALCYKINKSPLNLLRRMPIRQYIANPLTILSDSRKLISWLR